MQKSCKKCEKSKSIDDFHNDKRRKDGKYHICKECHYEYTRQRSRRKDVVEKRRAYYQKKKEEDSFKKASQKRSSMFYASIKGRARTLLCSAKRRSSDEAPCTLTAEYIEGFYELEDVLLLELILILVNLKTIKRRTHLHRQLTELTQTKVALKKMFELLFGNII